MDYESEKRKRQAKSDVNSKRVTRPRGDISHQPTPTPPPPSTTTTTTTEAKVEEFFAIIRRIHSKSEKETIWKPTFECVDFQQPKGKSREANMEFDLNAEPS
ncbi:hypothetical protein ACHQM5_009237 [Ranunculus cassubicifolius]